MVEVHSFIDFCGMVLLLCSLRDKALLSEEEALRIRKRLEAKASEND